MSQSEADRTTRRIRPPITLIVFPLMIGLFGFYRVAQGPQFESYRSLDVAQLLVSGAGFGVALVILMFTLLRPRF